MLNRVAVEFGEFLIVDCHQDNPFDVYHDLVNKYRKNGFTLLGMTRIDGRAQALITVIGHEDKMRCHRAMRAAERLK